MKKTTLISLSILTFVILSSTIQAQSSTLLINDEIYTQIQSTHLFKSYATSPEDQNSDGTQFFKSNKKTTITNKADAPEGASELEVRGTIHFEITYIFMSPHFKDTIKTQKIKTINNDYTDYKTQLTLGLENENGYYQMVLNVEDKMQFIYRNQFTIHNQKIQLVYGNFTITASKYVFDYRSSIEDSIMKQLITIDLDFSVKHIKATPETTTTTNDTTNNDYSLYYYAIIPIILITSILVIKNTKKGCLK